MGRVIGEVNRELYNTMLTAEVPSSTSKHHHVPPHQRDGHVS